MGRHDRRAVLALGMLVALLLYALFRVLDPEARWAGSPLRADSLEHGLVAYGLSLLPVAAFRPRRAWAPAAVIVGLGVLVEGLQGLGLLPGAAQARDILADLVGAGLALAPLWLLGPPPPLGRPARLGRSKGASDQPAPRSEAPR